MDRFSGIAPVRSRSEMDRPSLSKLRVCSVRGGVAVGGGGESKVFFRPSPVCLWVVSWRGDLSSISELGLCW